MMLPTDFLELECHKPVITHDLESSVDSIGFGTEDEDEVTKPGKQSQSRGDIKRGGSLDSDRGASADTLKAESEGTSQGPLDAEFIEAVGNTSDKLEQLEHGLRLYEAAKNRCLEDIDRHFDHLIQGINRRCHLLKNQVLGMYEEKVENIENDVDKLTCSLHCLDKLQVHAKALLKGCTGEKLIENTAKVQSEITELSSTAREVTCDAPVILLSIDEGNVKKLEGISRQTCRINNSHMLPSIIQVCGSSLAVNSQCWVDLLVEDVSGAAVSAAILETLTEISLHDEEGRPVSVQKTVPKSGMVRVELSSTESRSYQMTVILCGIVLKRLTIDGF